MFSVGIEQREVPGLADSYILVHDNVGVDLKFSPLSVLHGTAMKIKHWSLFALLQWLNVLDITISNWILNNVCANQQANSSFFSHFQMVPRTLINWAQKSAFQLSDDCVTWSDSITFLQSKTPGFPLSHKSFACVDILIWYLQALRARRRAISKFSLCVVFVVATFIIWRRTPKNQSAGSHATSKQAVNRIVSIQTIHRHVMKVKLWHFLWATHKKLRPHLLLWITFQSVPKWVNVVKISLQFSLIYGPSSYRNLLLSMKAIVCSLF